MKNPITISSTQPQNGVINLNITSHPIFAIGGAEYSKPQNAHISMDPKYDLKYIHYTFYITGYSTTYMFWFAICI